MPPMAKANLSGTEASRSDRLPYLPGRKLPMHLLVCWCCVLPSTKHIGIGWYHMIRASVRILGPYSFLQLHPHRPQVRPVQIPPLCFSRTNRLGKFMAELRWAKLPAPPRHLESQLSSWNVTCQLAMLCKIHGASTTPCAPQAGTQYLHCHPPGIVVLPVA